MTDRAERGPNGFPYPDMDDSKIGAWESGQFHLQIQRDDGETLRTNFRPEQFRAACVISDIRHARVPRRGREVDRLRWLIPDAAADSSRRATGGLPAAKIYYCDHRVGEPTTTEEPRHSV